MNSIEMGRETLKYVGKTVREISGIGRAQRVYREEISVPDGVYDKKPGRTSTFLYAVVNGIVSVGAPSAGKSIERERTVFPGLAIDMVGNAIALGLLREGNVQAAFIAKLGYNTLVQIAPDVAKLVKGRFLQRTK